MGVIIMGKVLDFPCKYSYVMDGDNIIGCCTDDLLFSNEGGKVNVIVSDPIDRVDVKELMVMWLALNYPEVLKFDTPTEEIER